MCGKSEAKRFWGLSSDGGNSCAIVVLLAIRSDTRGTPRFSGLLSVMPRQLVNQSSVTPLSDAVLELAKKTGAKDVERVARAVKSANNLGQPTKLTPLLASKIVMMVCEGNRVRTACEANAITKRTHDNWMARAKEWLEKEEVQEDFTRVPESERIFCDYFLAITVAQASAERSLLQKALSGKRGWQAAIQVLERRFSSGWSREVAHRHTMEGGDKPLVIEVQTDQDRAPQVAGVLQEAGVIDAQVVSEEDVENGQLVLREESDQDE